MSSRPSSHASFCPALLLVLSLGSCRHEDRAPAPSASVSALGNEFTVQAREQHFEQELARARALWPNARLAECAKALHEKADLELCQTAASAISTLAEPAPSAQLALGRLAPAALALARLSQRVRFLSLAELADRRVTGDAGVPAVPSSSAAIAGAPEKLARGHEEVHSKPGERRALELGEGAISELLGLSTRWEREAIRNVGAYLEYGPLPVRRAAFDALKGLRAQHPSWPTLDHLLTEAAVLEADPELRRDLRQLSETGTPQSGRPSQSAGTK